jgi:hypothetical protein
MRSLRVILASTSALPRTVRPDHERDPLTEVELELVEAQQAQTRQRRYPHAPSLGTRGVSWSACSK